MTFLPGRVRRPVAAGVSGVLMALTVAIAGIASAHDGHHDHGHDHGHSHGHSHEHHAHDEHEHDRHHDHQGHGPHVHGQGNLQLVVEGGDFFADLTVPGVDVVGFERAPDDEAARQAVRDAIAMLGDADKVLRLPDAAGCALASGSATSGLEQGGDGHGDFTAAFVFECRQPDRLERLNVVLFEHLPRLESVIVQMVSDAGQSEQRLAPRSTAVTMPR